MTKLWRPLEPAFVANPYPMYQQLRETDPVHQAQTGEWVITRYQDIKEIFKNPAFSAGNRLEWLKRGITYFNNKEEDLYAIYQAMNTFLNLLNPPRHTAVRALIAKAWTSKEVDEIISRNINRLLKQIKVKTFDFITAFAQPLPVLTISDILGIPTDDYRYVKQLGMTLTEAFSLYVSFKELVTINQAAKDMIVFFREHLDKKKQQPDESLMSSIINTNKKEAAGLTDDELVSLYIFLFNSGEETTSNLIGSGFYNLLRNPESINTLRQQPELMPSAVEELLRYDPSVQIAGRMCVEDFSLRNRLIPKGATVSLVIGSANRDPEIFKNPDELIIARDPNRHLTFGSGIHYCMGDWLARKQAQLALTALLDHFESPKLEEKSVEWNKILTFRGLKTMQVTVA
jgi:pimeloyl-[acyl-carrier protein] synthase